jgi:hypothetical protein
LNLHYKFRFSINVFVPRMILEEDSRLIIGKKCLVVHLCVKLLLCYFRLINLKTKFNLTQ